MQFHESITTVDIERIRTSLENLLDIIPEIRHFSWGENNSPETLNQGFCYGFEMEFNNSADRKIYLVHPQHIHVAENYILPALLDGKNSLLVFDYESKN